MPVSKAQQKAVNKYMSEKYDRINLVVPKGRRDELRAKAEAAGKSLNSYLVGLIVGEAPQYITPEALDKACFILAGIDEGHLLQAVDTAVQMNLEGDHGIPVPDYVEENVSTKVVKIIQSYTGVVDKMVWRK